MVTTYSLVNKEGRKDIIIIIIVFGSETCLGVALATRIRRADQMTVDGGGNSMDPNQAGGAAKPALGPSPIALLGW